MQGLVSGTVACRGWTQHGALLAGAPACCQTLYARMGCVGWWAIRACTTLSYNPCCACCVQFCEDVEPGDSRVKDCLEDNMNEDDFSDVGLGFFGWEGLGLGLWKGGLGSGGRWVGVKNCPEDNRNEDGFL